MIANGCAHHWIAVARSKDSLFVECSECRVCGFVKGLSDKEREEAKNAQANYLWRDTTRVEVLSKG